jgi:hypothetical protein
MPAFAQQRPAPVSAYSAKTMPWPGDSRRPAFSPAGTPRIKDAPRTMYFSKNPGRPVDEPAVGLAVPVGADEPLPQPKAPATPDTGVKPGDMFRLESELPVLRRSVPENFWKDVRLVDPKDDSPRREFVGRGYAPQTLEVEPNYVCHGRLLFEDKNTERYGWNFGPIQPFMSAGDFFGRMQSLPYLLFSFPFKRNDCSAGQGLPGDPAPYLLYPPGISLTGAAAQASVVVALSFIFP